MLAVVVLGTVAACSDRQSSSPPTVSIEDSAGVRVVRVPPLQSFAVPKLDVARVYTTRRVAGEALELFRVSDALFLADATLVLANSGTEELIFIDPEGASFHRFGGKGQGPGEFNGLSRLLSQADGGFLAWDFRLSRFGMDGVFVGTERLDPENRVVSLEPLAVYGDRRIVAVLGEQRYFQKSGERRDTVPLMVFDSGQAAPDTVGTWMGLERAFGALGGQATFIAPIGFARTVFFASNGERVAIGSSDSLDVTVFDSALRAALRLVAPRSGRPVTEAQKKAWRDFMLERLPMENDVIRATWSGAPIRETLPGFEGLGVDPAGRVWVGQATVPGSSRRRWVVFDADGIPLGEWEPKAGWFGYLPGRTELLALGADRVALLVRSEFDEESVEVWHVRWKE